MNLRLPGRLLAFAIVTFATIGYQPCCAQVRDWNARTGTWSTAAKWSPNLVPGVTNIVRIGNLPSAYDADVTLDVDTAVSVLQLDGGMRLRTNGHQFTTVFDTLITGTTGRSSGLYVEDSVYSSRDIINEARLRLGYGTVNVSRMLENSENSVIFGGGTINFSRDSGVALNNNGRISTNGAPSLTFNQLGNGLLDLDGSSGNGHIRVRGTVGQEVVTFNGTQLADDFNGRIDLESGKVLNMNFSNGWTAASSSEIHLFGHAGASPSLLDGGDWTMNGDLIAESDPFDGAGSHVIGAATILGASANVSIESENSIAFDGPVTINGGTYSLQQHAGLSFNDSTVVNGGLFATASQLGSEGRIEFNGTTAWQGNVSIDGIAGQNGNAIVSADTTINAGVFDLDGAGNTHWSISSGLEINADGVDSTISNSFDGTMLVAGGVGDFLEINLNQPGEQWTMAGEMQLNNPYNVGITRLAGSHMRLSGDLIATGAIGISADLTVDHPATVTFANEDSSLILNGNTLIEQSSSFVGDGMIINSTEGELTLSDGVSLDGTHLENYGTLELGSSPGIADVASFENFAEGTIRIEIGGYTLGDEHDFLLVSQGQAQLDGWIDVSLVDSGFGMFMPEVGDEFTVLSSLGGVLGTFDNSPVSQLDGQSFHWNVIYNDHDVRLHLSSISVPEPSATGLALAIGAPCFIIRRRRLRSV